MASTGPLPLANIRSLNQVLRRHHIKQIRSDGDIGCLQCGAIHTTDGRLETISTMMKLMMQQPEVDRYAVGANE